MKSSHHVLIWAALLLGVVAIVYDVCHRAHVETIEARLEREAEAMGELEEFCKYRWPNLGERYQSCLEGNDTYAGQP